MSNNKGFSGLNNLGMDIDDIVDQLDQTTSSKNDTEDVEESKYSASANNNKSNNSIHKSDNGSYNWIMWLLVVGIITWIIIISNSSQSNQQDYNSNNESVAISEDYYESKPDLYISILNKNQLLYCQAETIRLSAIQNKIDLQSEYDVEKYNSLSDDYNERCANKEYHLNDMNYVERNIDNKKE